MKHEEFLELLQISAEPQSISLSDLHYRSDRTLIYGYYPNRTTFHLYLKDKKFHVVTYDGDKVLNYQHGYSLLIEDCVPTKRIYPECCDAEFCGKLLRRGKSLPFTTFNPDRKEAQFYGKLYTELFDM